MPARDTRPRAAGTFPRRRRAACLGGAACIAAASAQAQTASGVSVTPTLSVQQTITDNRDLSSTNRQADAITVVTPGLRVEARNGQLNGGLNLGVNAIRYARASQNNTVSLQTALDSRFHYEALDNRVWVDATANASQQAISAFGTQSAGTTLVNGNRSQVTTVNIAPGFRGRIADFAQVEAQANVSKTDAGSTALGDSAAYGARLGISGGSGYLGWGLTASEQIDDYKAGRQTTTDQVFASLTVAPSYDWRVTGRVGRSRSDARGVQSPWVQTTGLTVAWQPTERTDLSLQTDRTYYGRSHAFVLRHRMERTVWSYIDTDGVSGDPNGLTAFVPLTTYDLLYANCLRSGGTAAACDAAVRQVLAQQGISPTLVVGAGFLYGSLTLQHQQTLAVSWSGPRQTATLSAFRTSSRALDKNNARGDLALVDQVRQQGMSLGASHQLTPVSTVGATLTWQKTLDAGAQAGNAQKMVTVNWSTSLSDRTTATLTLRHIEFTSATVPYDESAVLGTLSMSF